MEVLGWAFSFMFWAMYVVCLFTVCLLTFQKGHVILGVLGFFLPLLWLIGAVLPAKPGSRHDLAQEARFQAQAQKGST